MNRRWRAQRGLTLIELMVAMTIGLLVTLLAIGLLLLASRGLQAVDSTSDARDKERLAFEQLSLIVLQAGYEDWSDNSAPLQSIARGLGTATDPETDLFGWNNAIFDAPSDDRLSTSTSTVNGNRPAGCGNLTGTACRNGSDVLAVRYQGKSLPGDATKGDGSMLDCNGRAVRGVPDSDFSKRALSVFHVRVLDRNGEPTLYCSVFKPDGTWEPARPLLEGVEAFQVLYGTDGVVPGTAHAASAADSVPDRWLRADELTVAGDAAATRANWRRVRAVRIGLTVRGPVGSDVIREARELHPLGDAYVSADDAGSALTTASDGRLRTTRSITLHLRNNLAMP